MKCGENKKKISTDLEREEEAEIEEESETEERIDGVELLKNPIVSVKLEMENPRPNALQLRRKTEVFEWTDSWSSFEFKRAVIEFALDFKFVVLSFFCTRAVERLEWFLS